MKNVFDFRKELIGEYAKFSTSFAKPSADDIAARLKEEYGSGRYWREPLIQINPNYEKDKTVDEPAAADVLTAECASEKFAREFFGDEFVETLPANWQAKKFDTTCRRPLERIELDGIYDDDWFESFLAERSPKWLIGWRDITNATNSRTDIIDVFPPAGAGNTIPMLRPGAEPKLVACLIAESSTLAHDWAVRQKIGGVHMNAFYRSQLPNFPPSAYTEEDIAFVVPRALELTYTSYSLKPWAEALEHDGEPFVYDAARRIEGGA